MSRIYPDWIKAYISLFSGRTEAPEHLHYFTAVAAIGGVLCRQVWIEEQLFRFYPNFYTVFVAAPGTLTKSTTMSLGTSMLREVDGIRLAADCTTYPAFIRDLARHAVDIKDQQPGDSEDYYIAQCAVTAAISEFGTFFKPDDEDMINGLTDLWDCRPLMVKDTKTNGTDRVEHPFVNLIACTTPAWVQAKLKPAIGGWGLSSRIMFIYADRKSMFIARPSKMWPEGEYSRITQQLTEDLRSIHGLSGRMDFSPEADVLVEQWYEEHSKRAEVYTQQTDHNSWIGYFLARKQAHIHKLSMVLSASRRDSLIIEEEDFLEAVERIDSVEATLSLVFSDATPATLLSVAERKALRTMKADLSEANGHMAFPKNLMLEKHFQGMDKITAGRVIDSAISRGEFVQIKSGSQLYLRLGSLSDEPLMLED